MKNDLWKPDSAVQKQLEKKSTRKKRRKIKPVCRKCGLEIKFKKLDNGKWCPTNPDGSDHWDKCRDNQDFTGQVTYRIGKTMKAKIPLIPVECAAPPFVAE